MMGLYRYKKQILLIAHLISIKKHYPIILVQMMIPI